MSTLPLDYPQKQSSGRLLAHRSSHGMDAKSIARQTAQTTRQDPQQQYDNRCRSMPRPCIGEAVSTRDEVARHHHEA